MLAILKTDDILCGCMVVTMEIIHAPPAVILQCILQLKYFTGLSERLQRRGVSDKWLTWGSLQSSRGNRPVSH